MKEFEFLEIIKRQICDSSYIGDDCAYLDDLDIFVTQDTLVEGVHFSLHTTSPYLLGRKAVSVNLSDLSASLSEPKYISVSLSVPNHVKHNFVKELYKGISDVCNEYNVKVIGGDITGSDKVVISICAIGKKVSKYLSSRSYAKQGDYILVTGSFGASAAGFHSLSNFLQADVKLINSHLNPVPRIKESYKIKEVINENIAVMDSSDGLADALYKIANASNHSVVIDINKVPVCSQVIDYCNKNNLDYKNLIKWGGEDYELVLCVNEEAYLKMDKTIFKEIGRVQNKDKNPLVIIKDGKQQEVISNSVFEKKSFNHFD